MGALINLDLTVIKISKREVLGPVGVFLDLLGHCFGEHRLVQFLQCKCSLCIYEKHSPPATAPPRHSSLYFLTSTSFLSTSKPILERFAAPGFLCAFHTILHGKQNPTFMSFFLCKVPEGTPACGCTRGIIPAPYPVRTLGAALKVMPSRKLCRSWDVNRSPWEAHLPSQTFLGLKSWTSSFLVHTPTPMISTFNFKFLSPHPSSTQFWSQSLSNVLLVTNPGHLN